MLDQLWFSIRMMKTVWICRPSSKLAVGDIVVVVSGDTVVARGMVVVRRQTAVPSRRQSRITRAQQRRRAPGVL
jgi:hypothetical protein